MPYRASGVSPRHCLTLFIAISGYILPVR